MLEIRVFRDGNQIIGFYDKCVAIQEEYPPHVIPVKDASCLKVINYVLDRSRFEALLRDDFVNEITSAKIAVTRSCRRTSNRGGDEQASSFTGRAIDWFYIEKTHSRSRSIKIFISLSGISLPNARTRRPGHIFRCKFSDVRLNSSDKMEINTLGISVSH